MNNLLLIISIVVVICFAYKCGYNRGIITKVNHVTDMYQQGYVNLLRWSNTCLEMERQSRLLSEKALRDSVVDHDVSQFNSFLD